MAFQSSFWSYSHCVVCLSPLFSLFVTVPGQGSLLFSLELLLLLVCDQLRLKRLWQARCSKRSGGEQQLKFELVGVFTPICWEEFLWGTMIRNRFKTKNSWNSQCCCMRTHTDKCNAWRGLTVYLWPLLA